MSEVFLETPRFPERVSLQIGGGPMTSTDMVVTKAGFTQPNINWAQSMWRLRFDHSPLRESDFQALLDHWEAVHGPAIPFRVKNWFDYKLTQANSGLRGYHGTILVGGYGIGHGVPVLQIQRRHTRGSLSTDRSIFKPVATPTVYRNGSAVTIGASAGNCAVDTTTGRVTFVADASRSLSSVTVGATTQVVVSGSALAQVGIGDRLYLSGLTGADAALLNNLSHAVANLSGTTYTLSTNTAGKTITVGSGNALAYPQVDETLTVAGQFDLPMRFSGDEPDLQVLERGVSGIWYRWGGIELVEHRVKIEA